MENQLALSEPNIDSSIRIYEGASMLKIEEDEQKQLTASFDEKLIEIRPDGLIYLPQVFWRGRLNETFGIGQWCLVIKGSSKDEIASKCYVQGILMIRGCYVGEAVGESEYHQNNSMQSWASVWEAAKSDCITRCCKDLGIASELWQPAFSKKWVSDNAIQVWRNKTKNRGKEGCYQWRKKNAAPFYDENKIDNTNTTAHQPAATKTPTVNNKPVLSAQNFELLQQRIKDGEIGIYEKAKDNYYLTARQNEVLSDLQEQHSSQLQTA